MTTRNLEVALHIGQEAVRLPDTPPQAPGSVLIASPPASPGDPVYAAWGVGGGGTTLPPATRQGEIITSGPGPTFTWQAGGSADLGRF